MLAIGPHAGRQPGTGPMLMVAIGAIVETDLDDVRPRDGRAGRRHADREDRRRAARSTRRKDGNRTMFFAFGRPDTVVLGSNEAYVTEALGTGKKAPDDPELGAVHRAGRSERADLGGRQGRRAGRGAS